MTIRTRLVAAAAAGVLAMAPAFGQQAGGAGGGNQTLAQEQAQGSGARLQLSPATVRQVQQALNQQGYDVGQADGTWSQQTAQALQNFQQAQGLEPTGQLNQNTLSALGIQSGGAAAGGGAGGQAGGQQMGGSTAGQTGAKQGGGLQNGSTTRSGGQTGSLQGSSGPGAGGAEPGNQVITNESAR